MSDTAALLTFLSISAVGFVYFVLMEGVFGTTVGKLLGASPWRLKVVKKDGTRCGVGRAIIRALLLPLEGNILGAIVIWASGQNQRIGDLLAGTLVVDCRKVHQVTFLADGVVFEFLDGRRVELVQITSAKVISWLQFQRMRIDGLARDGRAVRLNCHFTREKYRMDRLQGELESFFQVRFVQTIEWWRLIWLIVGLGILLLSVLAVIGLVASK